LLTINLLVANTGGLHAQGLSQSDGEKIGDKFDKAYRKMRREKKESRSAKQDSKKKGDCECGK